jgi:hypothetical protein
VAAPLSCGPGGPEGPRHNVNTSELPCTSSLATGKQLEFQAPQNQKVAQFIENGAGWTVRAVSAVNTVRGGLSETNVEAQSSAKKVSHELPIEPERVDAAIWLPRR